MTAENMRTVETNEDLCFHLKAELRSSFDQFGLQHRGIHIIWMMSVAEQRLQNEKDLKELDFLKKRIQTVKN